MSLALHKKCSPYGLARVFKTTSSSEAGEDLRISGLARIEQLGPREFALVGEPLWPNQGDGLQVAYEDPTIFEYNGQLFIAFTEARRPISRLECAGLFPLERQSWHLAQPMVFPYFDHGWPIDLMRPMAEIGRFRSSVAPFNNLKEIEVLEGTNIVFCEVGAGSEAPSSIYWGRVSTDLQITELQPFIVAGNGPNWMSSHCSTGPIIKLNDNSWLMIMNGRQELNPPRDDVRGIWSIGCLTFTVIDNAPVRLSIDKEPIVVPQLANTYNSQAIAFAATSVEVGGAGSRQHCLYWHDDQDVYLTVIK